LHPPTSIAPPPDRTKLLNDVQAAKNRAYRVAWALRNPSPEAGYNLRKDPSLGWIAVSAEDDPPDHPVNVPSGIPIFAPGPGGKPVQVSAYPQYEIPITMCPMNSPPYVPYQCDPNTQGSVTFKIRYTVASLPYQRPGYVVPALAITKVFPQSGPITGGTQVHLSVAGGSATDMTVSFNGVTPPLARCLNPDCWFTTPPYTKPGPAKIVVTAPGASPLVPRVSSSPSEFTYTPTAELASFGHSSTDPGEYLVSLDGNAPSNGALIELKGGNSNVVSVPQTVTVRGVAAQVPLTFLPVPKDEPVTLTATYLGRTIPLNVTAPAWPAISISIAPGNTGAQAMVTVKLGVRAPAGGAAVTLSSSDPATIANASNPIAPGGYMATFPLVAHVSGQIVRGHMVIPPKHVTLTATYTYTGASTAISTVVPFRQPRCAIDDSACQGGAPEKQ
jgi:hypothetical protein